MPTPTGISTIGNVDLYPSTSRASKNTVAATTIVTPEQGNTPVSTPPNSTNINPPPTKDNAKKLGSSKASKKFSITKGLENIFNDKGDVVLIGNKTVNINDPNSVVSASSAIYDKSTRYTTLDKKTTNDVSIGVLSDYNVLSGNGDIKLTGNVPSFTGMTNDCESKAGGLPGVDKVSGAGAGFNIAPYLKFLKDTACFIKNGGVSTLLENMNDKLGKPLDDSKIGKIVKGAVKKAARELDGDLLESMSNDNVIGRAFKDSKPPSKKALLSLKGGNKKKLSFSDLRTLNRINPKWGNAKSQTGTGTSKLVGGSLDKSILSENDVPTKSFSTLGNSISPVTTNSLRALVVAKQVSIPPIPNAVIQI